MRMLLPYDRKRLPVEIDDRNFVGSLVSKVESYHPGMSPPELVEASLDHPIGSPRLEDLVKGKENIVIISSDHTRLVPSKIITPIPLRRIRAARPDANIKILVVTGFHRPSTHEELVEKYGQEIVDHEQIVVHVSTDDAAMVKIGTLPSGANPLWTLEELRNLRNPPFVADPEFTPFEIDALGCAIGMKAPAIPPSDLVNVLMKHKHAPRVAIEGQKPEGGESPAGRWPRS